MCLFIQGPSEQIYRLYTDACYAPNRGGALYRCYMLDRALAQPRQPTTTPIVPVVDHGFSLHLHPKCSNSPPLRTQQIHTHAHPHILPPPPPPHPHAPQHTHTHTITHTRAPTATVAGSSITHRCPAVTHHPASIKTPTPSLQPHMHTLPTSPGYKPNCLLKWYRSSGLHPPLGIVCGTPAASSPEEESDS